jgi:hypothetical protein
MRAPSARRASPSASLARAAPDHARRASERAAGHRGARSARSWPAGVAGANLRAHEGPRLVDVRGKIFKIPPMNVEIKRCFF